MTLCHVANLSSLTDNDYDNIYADTHGRPTYMHAAQHRKHACMHVCNRMEHTSTGAHGHRHMHRRSQGTLVQIINVMRV